MKGDRTYIYIYGKHAVLEAVAVCPESVESVFTNHAGELPSSVAVTSLNERSLPGGLSSGVNHQGYVAAINPKLLTVRYADFIADLNCTPDTALAIFGEIQDPHNVGAIIRSAAAFGLAGVLIPQHRQAGVTGTVVKVSAGMAFRIPLVEIGNVNTTIRDLKDRGFWVYGLAATEGSIALGDENFSRPSVFVVGNEGSGLREKTADTCDTLLSIPMHPRCESLNASVAAAITFQNWSQQHLNALR